MDISHGKPNSEMVYGDGKFITRLISPNETKEMFYNLIAKEVEWNASLEKTNAVCNVFPKSTFVTINEETKEVIAVVTVTPTHPHQRVVGNLIVRHDHRRQGHAKRMLKMVIDKHARTTLNLTAVPGTDTFYRKAGFREVEPVHHVYYIEIDRVKVDKTYSDNRVNDDISIECYTKEMFPALNDYDTNTRGYDCKKYLSVMTNTSNHFLVATSKTSGQVIGYAAGVDQSNLLWIDGMYADSDNIALCIFRKMLEAFPQKTEVRIQTVKPREFLVGFGKILPKSRIYTRMSNGTAAKVSLSKLYAVTDCDYAE